MKFVLWGKFDIVDGGGISKRERRNSYYKKTRICEKNVVQVGVKAEVRTIEKNKYDVEM